MNPLKKDQIKTINVLKVLGIPLSKAEKGLGFGNGILSKILKDTNRMLGEEKFQQLQEYVLKIKIERENERNGKTLIDTTTLAKIEERKALLYPAVPEECFSPDSLEGRELGESKGSYEIEQPSTEIGSEERESNAFLKSALDTKTYDEFGLPIESNVELKGNSEFTDTEIRVDLEAIPKSELSEDQVFNEFCRTGLRYFTGLNNRRDEWIPKIEEFCKLMEITPEELIEGFQGRKVQRLQVRQDA